MSSAIILVHTLHIFGYNVQNETTDIIESKHRFIMRLQFSSTEYSSFFIRRFESLGIARSCRQKELSSILCSAVRELTTRLTFCKVDMLLLAIIRFYLITSDAQKANRQSIPQLF